MRNPVNNRNAATRWLAAFAGVAGAMYLSRAPGPAHGWQDVVTANRRWPRGHADCYASSATPDPRLNRRMALEVALPAVEELLPHRYPFLLVDRITAIVPGKRAVGVRQVTADEWFTGQAGSYEMPNTLILEALAQLSGAVLIGLSAQVVGAVGYFVGMQRVKFRGVARAGDELVLECNLLQFKRGICKTAVTASVNGKRIVRAQITTVLRA